MELDLRTLDLVRLAVLSSVVENESFHGAADELMMAPSTVQKYMRAFEQDWQIKLFDREGRKIHVRDEAVQLAGAIQPVLTQARDLASHIEGLRSEVRTTIRLTCVPLHLAHYLGRVLRYFEQRHPDITVELNIISANAEDVRRPTMLKRRLQTGATDFVVANHHFDGAAEIRLWKTTLICVLADDHPLRFRQRISIKDLVNERMLGASEHWWSRRELDRLIAQSGLDIPVITEPLTDVAVGTAKTGLAVAVMADDSLPSLDQDYPMLVENGRRLSTEVSMHWLPQNLSESMELLLDLVKEHSS